MIWGYLISGATAVAVAIIGLRAERERKKTKAQKEKEEFREARRAEESRLSMEMMYSTLLLSTVTANALTNGHNNGNVEEAKAAAEKAKQEYQEFLQRVAAEQLAKK